MTVRFIGTRGNIPIRSPQHRRHSALLLSDRQTRLLVDCGGDWLGQVDDLRPTAILVTHGHPDHAGGLKRGAPCPVYATAPTWQIMARWPIALRRVLPLERPVVIGGIVVEARSVQHSVNAPAVGLKVSTRAGSLFYVPDVALLERPKQTLENIDVYVGDGARLKRPLVRGRGPLLIGHASVAAQLDWCRAGDVSRAIFTHCGSGVVRIAPSRADAIVRSLGHARGVKASLAYDGLTVRLRRVHPHPVRHRVPISRRADFPSMR